MTPDQRRGADVGSAHTVQAVIAGGGVAVADAHVIVELAAGSGVAGDCLCFEDELDEALVVVPLVLERTRIGRGLAADVRFDDPTVSRRHALIVRGPDGVVLFDERSRNGVLVNGRRIASTRLEHGDAIRIGHRLLCYARLDAGEGVGAAAPSVGLIAA